jgi:hypothetical protein
LAAAKVRAHQKRELPLRRAPQIASGNCVWPDRGFRTGFRRLPVPVGLSILKTGGFEGKLRHSDLRHASGRTNCTCESNAAFRYFPHFNFGSLLPLRPL